MGVKPTERIMRRKTQTNKKNHQATNAIYNHWNMEHSDPLCLWENSRTHKIRCYHWEIIGLSKVKSTGFAEITGLIRNLVLWREETWVWYSLSGKMHAVSSVALLSQAEYSPSCIMPNCTTWPSSSFIVHGDWNAKVQVHTSTGQEQAGDLASRRPTTGASDCSILSEVTI